MVREEVYGPFEGTLFEGFFLWQAETAKKSLSHRVDWHPELAKVALAESMGNVRCHLTASGLPWFSFWVVADTSFGAN